MKPITTISFPSGLVFEVLTSTIADDRTSFYAMQDPDRTREQHAAETAELFKDEFQVVDWAKNNMNWSDLEQKSRIVGFKPPLTLAQQWDDATLEMGDTVSDANLTSLPAEVGTLAPIALGLAQVHQSGDGCNIIVLDNPDASVEGMKYAVAFIAAPAGITDGYIAVLSQFNQFLSQQAGSQPPLSQH